MIEEAPSKRQSRWKCRWSPPSFLLTLHMHTWLHRNQHSAHTQRHCCWKLLLLLPNAHTYSRLHLQANKITVFTKISFGVSMIPDVTFFLIQELLLLSFFQNIWGFSDVWGFKNKAPKDDFRYRLWVISRTVISSLLGFCNSAVVQTTERFSIQLFQMPLRSKKPTREASFMLCVKETLSAGLASMCRLIALYLLNHKHPISNLSAQPLHLLKRRTVPTET